jgi:hypothetical protein
MFTVYQISPGSKEPKHTADTVNDCFVFLKKQFSQVLIEPDPSTPDCYDILVFDNTPVEQFAIEPDALQKVD